MNINKRSITECFGNRDFLWASFFAAIVLITFSPLSHAAYMLNFDDNTHFFYNSLARDGNWRNTPWDIFFTPDTANKTYIPLTILTYFYENTFWGSHPWISHTINLMLHFAVCAAAFFFARALRLSRLAAFTGILLFAVHPMHVEPVAWVTARKDLLYAFFYLLSLLFYLRYTDSGKGRDYIFALLAAALSILSKPMALSLPLVLFLLDWHRSRSFTWKLILEKLPFFLTVVPLALITYMMNARGTNSSWDYSPLLWVWCAMFYIKKFFFPVDLAAVYKPIFSINIFNPEYGSAFILCLVLLFFLWFWRRNRLVLFTAGFYTLSLFFIWRFDFYDLTFVADRFMYLPSLGFCFLFGTIVEKLLGSKYSRWGYPLLFAFLILLMAMTHARTGVWKDSYSLWKDNLKHYRSPFALNAFGESLLENHSFKDNKEAFIKALSGYVKTSPAKFKAVFAGSIERKVNAARKLTAIKAFYGALRLSPNDEDALDNVGFFYVMAKQYERAIPFFNRCIILSRGSNGTYFYNRGLSYEYLGDIELALVDYGRVIALGNDGVIPARLNRAHIMFRKGNYEAALLDIYPVIRSFPQYPPTYELAIKIAEAKKDNDLIIKLKKFREYYKKHAF